MVNEFGKFIRKLRIDLNLNMKDMADVLGVKTSFLSSIELSKKAIPDSIIDKIIEYYALSESQKEELLDAVAKTRGKVEIQLNQFEIEDQYGVLAFARKYYGLSSEQKKSIEEILNAD